MVTTGTGLDELLTLAEAAAYLRMSKATVQRWARDHQLPMVKVGKEYRISREDLTAWWAGMKAKQLPE